MSRTSVTDLILTALRSEHILTAPQLVELINQGDREYNKTSIYRALEKLSEDGLICKHSFGDNNIWYELRDSHHDHIVCTECSKVEAVHCQLDQPTRLKKYHIDHHHLTLYGVCPDCQTH